MMTLENNIKFRTEILTLTVWQSRSKVVYFAICEYTNERVLGRHTAIIKQLRPPFTYALQTVM
jgi:hypothetical protein